MSTEGKTRSHCVVADGLAKTIYDIDMNPEQNETMRSVFDSPEDPIKVLDELARRRGLSRSALLRNGMDEFSPVIGMPTEMWPSSSGVAVPRTGSPTSDDCATNGEAAFFDRLGGDEIERCFTFNR